MGEVPLDNPAALRSVSPSLTSRFPFLNWGQQERDAGWVGVSRAGGPAEWQRGVWATSHQEGSCAVRVYVWALHGQASLSQPRLPQGPRFDAG